MSFGIKSVAFGAASAVFGHGSALIGESAAAIKPAAALSSVSAMRIGAVQELDDDNAANVSAGAVKIKLSTVKNETIRVWVGGGERKKCAP